MHIRSEHDALEFLVACWANTDFGNDQPLIFKDCFLKLRLDPGNGQADRSMLRALDLLQRHLDLTYLLAKNGTPAGRLTEFERSQLSLSTTVSHGSTKVLSGLEKALTALHQVLPAHWSPRQRGLVVAGVLVATVTYPFAQTYMAYRTEIDKAHIVAASAAEVAALKNAVDIKIANVHANAQVTTAALSAAHLPGRIDTSIVPQILATLALSDSSNVVAFALSDYVPWRPALLALAPHAGTIQWNNEPPIPAKAAKAIAKVARAEAVKQRRIAKQNGHPRLIATPWVTEVVRTNQAPGAMRLGLSV